MKLRLALLLMLLSVAGMVSAQRLPRSIVPNHYALTFAPDLLSQSFAGRETILLTVAEPVREIVIHAVDLEFDEATIETAKGTQPLAVRLEPDNEWATLSSDSMLPPGPATLRIRFRGVLNENLRGFYIGRANGRKFASTQFEATDAREAFPCFDEPALKATFSVTAVVDQGDAAISNGVVIGDEPGPGAGKHTVRFATTPRLSTYQIALTVGDFRCTHDVASGTPLGICGTPDQIRMASFAMEATKFIVPWYRDYYGLEYPFEKLDQIGVADFRYGAMENPGAIIYRDSALFLDDGHAAGSERRGVSSTIAHEIGHMWFGDLVTMRWWDDVWLNEGFATWIQTKPLAAWHPEWKMDLRELAGTAEALTADSLTTSRRIRQQVSTPAEIMELFDGIAYTKTAAVLRMIESYVGEDVMRRGVGNYLASNRWGNATFHDFSEALSAASSPATGEVLRTFVEQAGTPLLRVSSVCQNGDTLLTIEQQRFYSAPGVPATNELWTIPVCYRAGGARHCELVRSRRQELRVAGCTPVFLNADGRGYYLVEPSSEMLADLVRTAKDLPPSERLVLMRDEWRLVRSGRRTVDEYLRLADTFRGEREPIILSQILETFRTIEREIASDNDREAFQAWVRAYVGPIARELGTTGLKGDSEERRSLRADALSALALTGHDKALIKEARTLIEKDISGKARLDPELLTTMTKAAAIGGDAKLFDAYVREFRRASTPFDRNRFLYALPYFSDRALLSKTMELAFSDEVRTQDAIRLLPGMVRDYPGGPAIGWELMEKHWSRVEQKLPEPVRGYLLTSADRFCSHEAWQHIKAFYAAHPSESSARWTARSLEQIAQCATMREMQSPKLHEWLTGRR